MKKIIFCFLLFTIILCACTHDKKSTPFDRKTTKKNSNPFFLKNKLQSSKFKGRFSFTDEGMIVKEVKILVNEIMKLKSGIIYELKMEPVKNVPSDRLILGYFYVMKDKIYKVELTKENRKWVEKKERIPSESIIVCQEREIVDNLDKEEKGEHRSLSINGDQREYNSYNDTVDTGYFESYIWKKDVGLKFYNSGYGAESNLIELNLIEE